MKKKFEFITWQIFECKKKQKYHFFNFTKLTNSKHNFDKRDGYSLTPRFKVNNPNLEISNAWPGHPIKFDRSHLNQRSKVWLKTNYKFESNLFTWFIFDLLELISNSISSRSVLGVGNKLIMARAETERGSYRPPATP